MGENDSVYLCVQNQRGVPDVPHAANVSLATEGSGVGVLKEPPVDSSFIELHTSGKNEDKRVINLCFQVHLTERLSVTWETILCGAVLYVEVPSELSPDGSKESFVTLLDYAETKLGVHYVVACFRRERFDRASLMRTFAFLGFSPIPPGHVLVPTATDFVYMSYHIDPGDSGDDDLDTFLD